MSLLKEGATVSIYDPKVPKNQILEDIKYISTENEFELNF